MVRENDLVAIFNGIHRVMKAEQVLKQARIEILLIPVPRELDSDCGLAIRFVPKLREAVEAALNAAGLAPTELYRKSASGYQRVFGPGAETS